MINLDGYASKFRQIANDAKTGVSKNAPSRFGKPRPRVWQANVLIIVILCASVVGGFVAEVKIDDLSFLCWQKRVLNLRLLVMRLAGTSYSYHR